MYSRLPSFVLGFHGCDASIADAVICGQNHLRPSQNAYDWLGQGIYFWEGSPARAMEYAEWLRSQGRSSGPQVKKPAVVGAIIDLGNCLNLLDARHISIVKEGYEGLLAAFNTEGKVSPQNKAVPGRQSDLPLRYLDCAVINYIHAIMRHKRLDPYETVRGAFVEGEPVYPEAGFREKTHIQISVCDHRCIKGYFRPIESVGGLHA